MAVTITIKDETDAVDVLTYSQIQLESAAAVAGPFTFVAAATLVAGQTYYTFTDPAGGFNTWYRYRLHHPVGPVDSSYSNVFQAEGATRKKIRQTALEQYDAGVSFLASAAGQSSTQISTTDDRVKSSLFRAGRGKGSWLTVLTGTQAGTTRRVISSNPTTGAFTVDAMAGALAANDEVEWHWLTSQAEWNSAINQAMPLYHYLDRVPIKGTGAGEIPLTFLPWLTNKAQIIGLWVYSSPPGVEEAWGTLGRWWGTRQEGGLITLMTTPALTTADTVYLEALRTMPKLYTDDDVTPSGLVLELAAALTYDQVLGRLTRPAYGAASVDRALWQAERIQHRQTRLRQLWKINAPQPRWQQPQFGSPDSVPQPFKAR